MKRLSLLALVPAFFLLPSVWAADPMHVQMAAPGGGEAMHPHMGAAETPAPADTRQAVDFPPPLREHELANMRDHLLTLQRIQLALAEGKFQEAADLAEQRLGMSSFRLHGAAAAAPHMPKGMQETGTEMHHAASRFALAASDAGVTGEFKPALAALAQITAQCVACHAAYKLK
jgi:hypothetical protein